MTINEAFWGAVIGGVVFGAIVTHSVDSYIVSTVPQSKETSVSLSQADLNSVECASYWQGQAAGDAYVAMNYPIFSGLYSPRAVSSNGTWRKP